MDPSFDEQGFQQWYANVAKKLGIAPNPDDKEHYYNYRDFYDAMKRGEVVSPDQPGGHWPSKFKSADHPRSHLLDPESGRFFDTKTDTYTDGDGEHVPGERMDRLNRFGLADLSAEQLAKARMQQPRPAAPKPQLTEMPTSGVSLPRKKEASLMDKGSAFARGAGQGATFGFGDEAISAILAALPGPKDPDGIPREYAAGSAEQDYLASERRENQAAAEKFPTTYGAGEAVGALPAVIAAGGAGGGVAGAGLSGGLMGGLSGAGHADGADTGNAVGRGAAVGAGLGAGGAALAKGVQAAAPAIRDVLSSLSRPQLATAPAGVQISRSVGASVPPPPRAAVLPPRPTTGDMPEELFIPKAPKNLVPEEAIGASEDLADASMASNTADAVLGGETNTLRAQRARAEQVFEKARKPVQQTEKSVAKTAPPKRKRQAAERATVPEQIDPKAAYQRAAQRNAQTPPARGPQPAVDDTTPTGIVPPPPQYAYRNAPAAGPTVPAPTFSNPRPQQAPAATPTVRAPAPKWAPSMRPTAPPPAGRATVPAPPPPDARPTMPDLGPVKPTLRPGSEQAYRDAVLKALADGLR